MRTKAFSTSSNFWPRVARHREHDRLHVGRHLGQIDDDLLVVTIAVAGEVVARMLDGTVAAVLVAEVDGLEQLLVRIERSAGRIEIDGAGTTGDIPAEAENDLRKRRSVALLEGQLLTFDETEGHVYSPCSIDDCD